MLIRHCVHYNTLFSKVRFSSLRCRFYDFASTSLFKTLNLKSRSRTYVMTSNSLTSLSNGNARIDNDNDEPRRSYEVVVAATRDMGIGKDGKLPWRLPSDLKFFKEVTVTTSDPGKKNAVVMGRKTWESIPTKYRPLSGRLNVVLTRSRSFSNLIDDNVVVCGSIPSALELLAQAPCRLSIEKVFVIGGGQILREALNAPGCDAVHITEIETSVECDTFIPAIDLSLFQLWYSSQPLTENGIRFSFATYVRVKSFVTGTTAASSELECDGSSNYDKFEVTNFTFLPKLIFKKHDNYMFLRLVEEIISSGNQKDDRKKTGTLSKFGCQVFSATHNKVFWRGVVEELLCFISGSTNAMILQEKGIHIRDGNASMDYLDSIDIVNREEGDVGPIYGFQGRHFGARRIIVSAWNPSDLKLMALPPCHMFAQFHLANGELSCQMCQCSADMGLGVPFDIAAYAIIICMIAHVCGLFPGDFTHVIGDDYVYKNHARPLKEPLQKLPIPFPILRINPEKDIDSFVASDFELTGYDPHQKIEMKMAV